MEIVTAPIIRDSSSQKPIVKLNRGRGRPQASDPSGDELREVIIAAAVEVYAENGYAKSSVQKILVASGVSRPTFYRYFQDRYEVIDIVVARINDDLIESVARAVGVADTFEGVINAMVDTYFSWGNRIGNLAGPVYREVFDESSPACAHRLRVLAEVNKILSSLLLSLDQRKVDNLVIDAVVHLIEHTGHEAFWPTPKSDAEQQHRKVIIINMIRAITSA